MRLSSTSHATSSSNAFSSLGTVQATVPVSADAVDTIDCADGLLAGAVEGGALLSLLTMSPFCSRAFFFFLGARVFGFAAMTTQARLSSIDFERRYPSTNPARASSRRLLNTSTLNDDGSSCKSSLLASTTNNVAPADPPFFSPLRTE